ncbi:hypothetical protein K491DRAFT_724466 [Lophiostoma macrostomum CBS 122681]|uniref:FAS1 domain-containing protein n=1 Tax=Lophiostoma macrostomum CBS 122681 TaxID=1314788 RepID=A0A6A6TSM5_9PLEO|nr:hypothetical protein K491DRAFT_724466 [Lophiostoma macrostomum CBS 122681]
MKLTHLSAFPTATICLVLAASAQSRPFDSIRKAFEALSEQSPLGSSNLFDGIMSPPEDTVSTGVIISDVIGKTQSIGIFSGLTRDIGAVSDRLNDAHQNATVLAPDNSAMKNLDRKPWEDPKDYQTLGATAYEGGEGEDRANRNLRRFVESHIVPESPWEAGKKVNTLAGNEIWYETKGGKTKIQPQGVEVTSIADEVANGQVWILSGSLS